MDALDIVARTASAAFATERQGTIVAWNPAMERLLGRRESQVLGSRCYQVLCGTDLFGNRFCDESCALVHMARRQETVQPFELYLQRAAGRRIRTSVSSLVLPARPPLGLAIVHFLTPLPQRGSRRRAPGAKPGSRPRPPEPSVAEHAGLAALSRRELQVLQLLCAGEGTREIAEGLSVSVATARNHAQHVLRKLGVHSRVEAVALATRAHLV